MAEALTTLTKLVVVREILEDKNGATLSFQQGGHGRLSQGDANFPAYLRLARRSNERQHPVGVSLGDGNVITELIRADNDVPTQVREEDSFRVHVFFQGHDGVFQLQLDNPESVGIRTLLDTATSRASRVWFIAQKPDLALLDVLPAD